MLSRLLRDYNELCESFFAQPIHESIHDFYLVIIGPKDTPYQDIPFVFRINVPDVYPFEAPSVSYVSFTETKIHPNLYLNGKVCLSLLGTYIGPNSTIVNRNEGWSPIMTLLSLAKSLQSILHDKPLLQEPMATDTSAEKIEEYNQMVSTECRNCVSNYRTIRLTLPVKKYILRHLAKLFHY